MATTGTAPTGSTVITALEVDAKLQASLEEQQTLDDRLQLLDRLQLNLQHVTEHDSESVRAAASGDDVSKLPVLRVLKRLGDQPRRLLERLGRCRDEGEREAARSRLEVERGVVG